MLNLLPTFKGAVALVCVAITGGIAGSAVGFFAETINESTPITLGIVGSVGLGCWYLSGTLHDLKSGIKELKRDMQIVKRSIGLRTEVANRDDKETSTTE